MILFAILLTVVLAIAIFIVASALAGAGFIAVFGDIIVFALIVWAIVLIVKFFKREK